MDHLYEGQGLFWVGFRLRVVVVLGIRGELRLHGFLVILFGYVWVVEVREPCRVEGVAVVELHHHDACERAQEFTRVFHVT